MSKSVRSLTSTTPNEEIRLEEEEVERTRVYVHTLHEMDRSVALFAEEHCKKYTDSAPRGSAWAAGASDSHDRLRGVRSCLLHDETGKGFAVFRGRRAMSSPVLQKQPRYFLSIAGIMEPHGRVQG